MLECQNLSFSYKSQAIFTDFHLTVSQGQTLCLKGPSGCGKSTLLYLISGLLKPHRGRISFEGNLWNDDHTFVEPHKRNVAFVFQDFGLFPHLSAKRNILLGLPSHKSAELFFNLTRALKIDSILDKKPDQLSGGQQQRVAIARAFVRTPKLLLRDEPFSQLDVELCHLLRQDLNKLLKEHNMTAIISTHNPEDTAALADEVLKFDDRH